MIRRRRTTTAPTQLRDLVLVTATPEGDVRLPGLALSASADSLDVIGPAQQILRTWPWAEVTGLVADESAHDGRVDSGDDSGDDGGVDERAAERNEDHPPLRLLRLTAADRCHRFLVGDAELSAFLDATDRYGSAGGASTGGASAGGASTGGESTGGELAGGTRAGGAAAGGRLLGGRRRATSGNGLGVVRRGRPRHARMLRVRPIPACIGAAVLAAGGATFGTIGTGGAQAANRPGPGTGVSIMSRMANEYASRVTEADLPAATTPPAPAPPSLAGAPALQAHEIFGFAPYWTLPQSAGFDVADLTTIAYFSLGVNGDGSIQESGTGWAGYQSQDLANLITRAHAAGSRVVLTVTCFGQSALNQLTSDPAAPKELASSLIPLVSAKSLDGVNFDFEGEGDGDQAGLTSLMAQVSAALKAADPHWQVTMDTYASSAGDPGGFYDIAGLAPSVDAFFVMAYDMNATTPSPTAALTGSGFTDLDALEQYTAVVPASKVILGVPYYGYDWPTTGPGLGATATGPKSPLSYAQIAAAGHPVYWDPTTKTAWTSYQVGTQWHQTWFDNPTSLALKAQLASFFHVAGLGVWALGMDGNDPAMLTALLGHAPVVKNLVAGPVTTTPATSSTTTTTVAGAPSYSYAGVWNGSAVTLTAVSPGDLPDGGQGQAAGTLSDFSTDDPSTACLESGGSLAVTELAGEAGVFLVTAQTPGDCADGSWTFASDSGLGGGGGSGPTTTTTTTTVTTTTTEPTTTTTIP